MNGTDKRFGREVLRRLARSLGFFLTSPAGGKAKWLIAALLLLMLCINGANVVNSFVGRHFMSSIESRDTGGFIRFAWLYVAVFASSTFVGVIGQSAMAFATLLGAFSLVITQFQAISAYASVILRLGEFVEAAEKSTSENHAP